jgi:Flp pilus assembly protein TadG
MPIGEIDMLRRTLATDTTGKVRATRSRAGAILSTELLFLLPILLVIVLAVVEFAFLLTAETRLTAATREGARVAALGGNSGDVLGAINLILGNNLSSQIQFEVDYPNGSSNTGDPVQVVVTVPATVMVPNWLRVAGFDLSQTTLASQTTMILEVTQGSP